MPSALADERGEETTPSGVCSDQNWFAVMLSVLEATVSGSESSSNGSGIDDRSKGTIMQRHNQAKQYCVQPRYTASTSGRTTCTATQSAGIGVENNARSASEHLMLQFESMGSSIANSSAAQFVGSLVNNVNAAAERLVVNNSNDRYEWEHANGTKEEGMEVTLTFGGGCVIEETIALDRMESGLSSMVSPQCHQPSSSPPF